MLFQSQIIVWFIFKHVARFWKLDRLINNCSIFVFNKLLLQGITFSTGLDYDLFRLFRVALFLMVRVVIELDIIQRGVILCDEVKISKAYTVGAIIGFTLASNGLSSHSISIPYLKTRVTIASDVGRLVRNDIFSVDHSEQVLNLPFSVLGILLIAGSWLAECINFNVIHRWMMFCKLDSGNDSNCTSQTVPSKEDTVVWICFNSLFNCIQQALIGKLLIGSIKSSMQLAFLTYFFISIRMFFYSCISQEVFDIIRPSEYNDYHFDSRINSNNRENIVTQDLLEHFESRIAIIALTFGQLLLRNVVDCRGEVNRL